MYAPRLTPEEMGLIELAQAKLLGLRRARGVPLDGGHAARRRTRYMPPEPRETPNVRQRGQEGRDGASADGGGE